MNEIRKIWKKHWLYVCTFLVWAIFVALIPYTLDDWTWGSEVGDKRLANWFEGYSGRYLGNLIELALTRSQFLRIVMTASFITAIPVMIQKLTGHKSNYVVALLLILVMPLDLWKMTIAWTAGFSNYITSVVGMLAVFFYLWRVLEGTYEKQQKIKMAVVMLILGIANTLIVEHMTLYSIVIAVGMIGYTFWMERKVYVQQVGYLSGCVIGTYKMFSNSVYHNVVAGKDNYRSVADRGMLYQIMSNYMHKMYQYFLAYNVWVNIMIIGMLWLIWKKRNDSGRDCRWLKVMNTIFSAFWIWSIMAKVSRITFTNRYFYYVDGAITFVVGMALLSVLVLVFWETEYRLKMLFLCLSHLCLCMELLMVNPVSERCFFTNYVLWIIIVASMFEYVSEQMGWNGYVEKVIQKAGIIAIVTLAVFYLGIYTVIHVAAVERVQKVHRQVAAHEKIIELPYLPFEEYMQGGTPRRKRYWINAYKSFYKIPQKARIRLGDPEEVFRSKRQVCRRHHHR